MRIQTQGIPPKKAFNLDHRWYIFFAHWGRLIRALTDIFFACFSVYFFQRAVDLYLDFFGHGQSKCTEPLLGGGGVILFPSQSPFRPPLPPPNRGGGVENGLDKPVVFSSDDVTSGKLSEGGVCMESLQYSWPTEDVMCIFTYIVIQKFV